MKNFYTYKIFYKVNEKCFELEVKKEKVDAFVNRLKSKGYEIESIRRYYYPRYIITRVLPSDAIRL